MSIKTGASVNTEKSKNGNKWKIPILETRSSTTDNKYFYTIKQTAMKIHYHTNKNLYSDVLIVGIPSQETVNTLTNNHFIIL